MYEFKEFPKMIYHKIEAAKIVNSKEEQDECGKSWKEVPFETAEVKAEESQEDVISAEPEATYKEHMANWESKKEKEVKPKAKSAKKAK